MAKPKNGMEFYLDANTDAPAFHLEAQSPALADTAPLQVELYLPVENPEQPSPSPQAELAGMAAPRYHIELNDGSVRYFQHAQNLLESLLAQDVPMHYQCREGYCGSCRVQLLQGNVHYTLEPMAWLNEGEILTCCCIPKTHLKIKVD